MAIVITKYAKTCLLGCRNNNLLGSASAVFNKAALLSTTTSGDGDGSGDGSIIEPSSKVKPKYSPKFVKSVTDKEIRKSVFISQSNDVFTNLALEDWIYRNFDFTYHHILMLWSNNPCVVIGRHQNPFLEANISGLEANGIQLARRNSGGGAVYHDKGNLNCTFFTPRERYNRKYNLSLITRALYREYAISADVTDRDDIVIVGKKVSKKF